MIKEGLLTHLSDTAVYLPPRPRCQVHLLLESELAHEVTGFRVGILPRGVRNASSPWRRVLGRGGLVAVASGHDDGVLVDIVGVCCIGELSNSVSTFF